MSETRSPGFGEPWLTPDEVEMIRTDHQRLRAGYPICTLAISRSSTSESGRRAVGLIAAVACETGKAIGACGACLYLRSALGVWKTCEGDECGSLAAVGASNIAWADPFLS